MWRVGGDRLLVADIHQHAIDERHTRRLRSDGNARLRGEHREADRFERDGLAACVRAADDEHGLISTERESHRDNAAAMSAQRIGKHRMPRVF